MDDSGEARLLAAAQSGSAESLAEIVRRQTARVFDFLAAVTGDLSVAEALSGPTLLDFAQQIERARTPTEIAPRAFRAAWAALEDDGWFSGREPGADAPAFAELSRRRAAVLDLVQRQGLDESGLAIVLGVSSGSATLIRARVMDSAASDLGADGVARLGAYGAVRARNPGAESLAAIQRVAAAARPPAPAATTETVPNETRRRAAPARAVAFLCLALGGLASLLALMLLAPMSPLALTRSNDGAVQAGLPDGTPTATPRVVVITVTVTAGAGGGTATPTASATRTGSATPRDTVTPGGGGTATVGTASATATRTPATTASASRTPTPTAPAPTRTPTPTQVPATPTPTATATPTVCAPRLQVFLGNPPQATVPPGGQVVRVFNSDTCGGAPFVAAASGWLAVQPTSGAIPAFGFVDLQLLVTGNPEPGDSATLTVVGPANELTIVATFSR
ncbi:MAG: hypothetical protein AB7T37_13470 [Dehalococcoidia bacterium]